MGIASTLGNILLVGLVIYVAIIGTTHIGKSHEIQINVEQWENWLLSNSTLENTFDIPTRKLDQIIIKIAPTQWACGYYQQKLQQNAQRYEEATQ